jgi:alpha-methylacyl-CoA racemase
MGFLTGVRVVDFDQHGPGARAVRVLADYGAEVVRIARPRHRAEGEIETPSNAYGGGRGLHRVAIDLKHEQGRALAQQLASRADVVIETFRPGVAARLGLGPHELRARNPRLVYCSLTGYGQHGPRSGWVGHDLNYAAVAGLLAATQPRADGGPPVLGATVADGAGGGLHAVTAVLAALVHRDRTGEGVHLDVAAVDGVLWLMSVQLEEALAPAPESPVRLLSGAFACYRTYECRDGRWLSVGALEARFWQTLCQAIGMPGLVDDQLVDARQPELIAALAARFRERDRDTWVAQLGPLATCVAPVLTPAEVLADEHLAARGLRRGDALGALLAGGDRAHVVEHLDVWRELGLDAEQVQQLADAGVIEQDRP